MREHFTTREDGRAGDLMIADAKLNQDALEKEQQVNADAFNSSLQKEWETWYKDLHDDCPCEQTQCGNWIVALVWWGLILGIIAFWLGAAWLFGLLP